MPLNAPFPGFTPELLAQLARGAFRPPGVMGGGGMAAPGLQMPQQGGGNMGLGAGMAGLGYGLGALAKQPTTDGRTTPEGTVSPFPVGGGPMGPSGGAMAESPLLPAPTGSGWSDFWSWLKPGGS